MANEKVSQLAGFIHYFTGNIILKVATKTDRFGLSEHYNQVLKACQDMSVSPILALLPFYFILFWLVIGNILPKSRPSRL